MYAVYSDDQNAKVQATAAVVNKFYKLIYTDVRSHTDS